MSSETQYCTFFVDGLLFGVEVLQVQEIMSEFVVGSVPLAPPTIAGLINHRGQIVTAIDMRKRLDLPASTVPPARMLVVRCQEETFALLVDKIGDVVAANPKDFEEAPENVNESARELVEGAYKLTDRLLLPLRLEKIAQIAN
ncbi:MAG TPA: chemotaxis protein CheW [Candidatus Angelobacter sp.]|nr:chemotaxis protein CheW [Candidatus Angelobacter sp.]